MHGKQKLKKIIDHHIAWCKQHNAQDLAIQWNEVLNYMWSKDHSYYMTEFKKLTQIMDQHRHESLATTIPELANLL